MQQESQYLSAMSDILATGNQKGDRTGTGTISKFGGQMRFKLNDGKTFPLFTTKNIHWKSVAHELIWLISGNTNIKYLKDNGIRIWDEWADELGNLGPVYGEQWRHWPALSDGDIYWIDQLQEAIDTIKNNPNSRRIIVSAWNPADLPNESISPLQNVENGKMALATCHSWFQFYVHDGKLSLQMYQRSCDMFLGVPFNIASYSLLLLMVARVTGLEADEFVHTLGDYHIYNNHLEQVTEQVSRTPYDSPEVFVPVKDSIDDYTFEDFEVIGYEHHPHIAGKVSV